MSAQRCWPFSPQRTLLLRFKTLVQGVAFTLMCWSSKLITNYYEPRLIDDIGITLESFFMDLWSRAREGSDEELQSVIDNEIPPAYMSARQLAVIAPFRHQLMASCCEFGCHWEDLLPDDGLCPDCGKSLMLRDPLPFVEYLSPAAFHWKGTWALSTWLAPQQEMQS